MSSTVPAVDQLLLKKYGLAKAPSGVDDASIYFTQAQEYANALEIYTNAAAAVDDAKARIAQAEIRVEELRKRAHARRVHARANGLPRRRRDPNLPPRLGPIAQAKAELKAIRENKEKIVALQQNPEPQKILIQSLADLCVLMPDVNQKTKDATNIPVIADNVMRAAFVVGFGLALANLFVAAPAIVVAAVSYGFAWNFVDAAAGALSISYGKERSSDHNKLWDMLQISSAVQLGVGTGLALVNTLGELGPAAFGCLGGVTFAVCMWVSAAQEAYYTYRALRKSWDTDYFIEERKEAIVAETKLLVDRRTWLDRLLDKEPILPTGKQLEQSRKKIEVMTKQLDALKYYNEHKNDNSFGPINHDERQKMAIAHILIAKEKEKAKEHAIKCGVGIASGAVMTVAIFFMPPLEVAAGAIVALLKGGQIVEPTLNDDYSEKAVQAVNKKEKNENKKLEVVKDELLTKAIRNILVEKLHKTKKQIKRMYTDEDIVAIKAALSKKHKEQLTYAQARADYHPLTYLGVKADEAKLAAETAASTLSNKICTFFSVTPSSGAIVSAPPALTH